MGLNIKKNKAGKYKLTSTVSDEQLHDEKWISEDEVKKILITRKFWDFVEKSTQLDMEFPNGYHVNGEFARDSSLPRYYDWWLAEVKKKNSDEIFITKFDEILKRLDLGIKLGTNKETVWEVGFGYYYSEHRTTQINVRGTREQALDYLKNTFIPTQPEWMTRQISDKPYSEDNCGIFISEVKIIDID